MTTLRKPCAFAAVFAAAFAASAREPVAKAVFGPSEIRLYAQPLAYEVLRKGAVAVPETAISITLDGRERGLSEAPAAVRTERLSGAVETPVYKKASVALDGEQTLVSFGDFAVRLAARADGAAWRFELEKPATVDAENAALSIPSGALCRFNRTPLSRLGCEETVPERAVADALPANPSKAFYLPFMFETPAATVAVTESAAGSYPSLYFGNAAKKGGAAVLPSVFAPYPKTVVHTRNGKNFREHLELEKGGRWIAVKESEPYLVRAEAPRALPWRVFALADRPAALMESDIVFALAEPAASGADFSWVRPGKVAWDWWNAFCHQGGKGCNTETYRRYIDFASSNGVEYVILDEGWSAALDIWHPNPAVDVPALISYAGARGVGIILWMAWAQVCGDEERVAEHFSMLGAKGFKIDFIDRADAAASAFMDRCAAACASHRMLVDFHGAVRPSGLSRKYPNILNYEGIHGLEQMKWAPKNKDMSFNDVACCFLRMTAGPMDYTPGAMDNYAPGDYRGNGVNPGSSGTRCRQIAMMSLYEAPLQMLCDSPVKYERNMECFKFMAATPTVWDDTVALGGTPETFAAAARKAKDGSWHASGVCGREARDFSFSTAFLGKGRWNAEFFTDGPDGSPSESYRHFVRMVAAGDTVDVRMAPCGGFAVRFSPVREPRK